MHRLGFEPVAQASAVRPGYWTLRRSCPEQVASQMYNSTGCCTDVLIKGVHTVVREGRRDVSLGDKNAQKLVSCIASGVEVKMSEDAEEAAQNLG